MILYTLGLLLVVVLFVAVLTAVISVFGVLFWSVGAMVERVWDWFRDHEG